MSFILKKASKQAKKMRVLFSASAGSGKTYSALQAAYGLCGDWNKICVIDSERDSASLYSDMGEFNTISIAAPYTPERYIEAIETAENAGMDVIIIDSITHEWNGEGGCLEIHSKLGGEFRNWASVTPRHNKFVNKILTSSSHIFCTVRRKEEYAIVAGANGRSQVQKMGLQEVTRDGFNYEMDIVFEITNNNHLAIASKDRTGLFVDKPEFLISKETGSIIKDWASKGRSELDDTMDMIRNITTIEDLQNLHSNSVNLHSNSDYVVAIKAKKKELTDNK